MLSYNLNTVSSSLGRKFSCIAHSTLTLSISSLIKTDYSQHNGGNHDNRERKYTGNGLRATTIICSLFSVAPDDEKRLKVSQSNNKVKGVDQKAKIDSAVKSVLTVPEIAILWKQVEETYGSITVRPGFENYFTFHIVEHNGLYKRRTDPTIFISTAQDDNGMRYLILGHLISISFQESFLQIKKELANKFIDTATAKEKEKRIATLLAAEIDRLLKVCEAYNVIQQPPPPYPINIGPKYDPLQPHLY